MSATAMWTSKLGNKYPMALMQQNDQASQQELKRLRSLSGNSRCADCGRQDNSWASVTHGVFICMICSDVHRSVGTHITKVKGCTGTYLWGPDELEKMRTMGNRSADETYGAGKVDPSASKEQKQRYVDDKYEKRALAGEASPAPAKTDSAASEAKPKPTTQKSDDVVKHHVRKAQSVEPAQSTQHFLPTRAALNPVAREVNVSDSLFDDFFNDTEDSYFGAPSAPVKMCTPSEAQPTSTPCANVECALDAFLNTTLRVETQPAASKISGYPAALDPFQNTQKTSVTDPFADWPDF